MNDKYWDEKFEQLWNICSPDTRKQAISILKQIARDQREACAKEIEDIIDPDKKYHEMFGRYIVSTVRTAEIDEN